MTILLGLEFLRQTALEWRHLIADWHLTITTNLFGTTFYSLVGLHASHVVLGLTLLSLTLGPWAEGQHVWTGSAIRIAGLVLALRRCRLGRGVHRCLRDWTLATMHENNSNSILVPAPTPWPFIAALGITLMFSGIVTHIAVTMVGTVVLLRAAIGWWFDVLPDQKEEAVR